MDDPTLGLDTAIRRQFLEGMIQLIQRQGRTIIFSSHILSDVERVARQNCRTYIFPCQSCEVRYNITYGRHTSSKRCLIQQNNLPVSRSIE